MNHFLLPDTFRILFAMEIYLPSFLFFIYWYFNPYYQRFVII